MKTTLPATLAALLCAGLFNLHGADKVDAGPKGGRFLVNTTPKAEFFVEKDHTVSIRFYEASGKVVAPEAQQVTVIAEAAGAKQKVDLTKKGDALVSTTKLPPGDGYNLVVQFKQTPDARPQNYRFKLDTSVCGGCKHAEYACSCHD
jgi:hypothetical protein